MRADDIYVAVDLGSLGQNGRGGHAHNDTLSFELFAAGQTWIQDPGTYVYTSDYRARNSFRSSAFHNTLNFADYEQNSFNVTALFAMNNESASRPLSWQIGADSSVYLSGELRRLKHPKVIHRRSFFLDRVERVLILTDWIHGMQFQPWSVLHIAPKLQLKVLESPYSGIRLSNSQGQVVQIFSVSLEKTKIQVSTSWISESYGIRKPGDVVSFEQPIGQAQKTAIVLSKDTNNPLARLDKALSNELMFIEQYKLIQPGAS